MTSTAQRLKWPCLAPAPFSKNKVSDLSCPSTTARCLSTGLTPHYERAKKRGRKKRARAKTFIGLLGTPGTPPCGAATLAARPPPVPAPHPTPRPPPKFSESRRRSADDRPARDPWHPSVRRCDARSTAAACPRNPILPRPPPPPPRRNFPGSRCPSRSLTLFFENGAGASHPPPKFSESRRRSVDDRPARDPWHPSVRSCDPRSTAAACPRSPPYPDRRRNFQSPQQKKH